MTLDLFGWKPSIAEHGTSGRDNPDHAHAEGGGHVPQGASSAAGNVADPQLGPEGTAAPSTHAPRSLEQPADLDAGPRVECVEASSPASRRDASKSLEDRFADFHRLNPHVGAEMLRLARARLDRGETFISVKALWEELRVSLSIAEDGGAGPLGAVQDRTPDAAYKLNNSYTALYARLMIKLEPRLERVIEIRKRKGEGPCDAGESSS